MTERDDRIPDQMQDSPRFEMKVDLAVLQSLGINLYSNAAAVLTEAVANAWDADANEVHIDWSPEENAIIIEDDGLGMSAEKLNQRYLKVGYQKRLSENEGTTSPKYSRAFMGRKGIGKLSIFSLASDITVETREKDGDPIAIHIALDDLKDAIHNGRAYPPDTLPAPTSFIPQGTRITLRKLNTQRVGVTIAALRRRLARRFDVLNYRAADRDRFEIFIGDNRLSYDDRQDLSRIEYMWSFGPNTIPPEKTPKVKHRWVLDPVVDEESGWELSGWFGTTPTPSDLLDEADESESLRNIMVLARRRPIQEGILEQLNITKLFSSYVTGQVNADFLDLDDDSPDIATSDRQRLLEDDVRVEALRTMLKERFAEAERQWSSRRRDDKYIDLTDDYPEVREWAESRPVQHRSAAKKMVSTIATLTLDQEQDRRELFKAGVLGFERLALDTTVSDLEEFADNVTAGALSPVLFTQDRYEDALYSQIVKSRLTAIEQLKKLVTGNELEKSLQAHIFDNLWLLDPAWEHASAEPAIEQGISRMYKDVFHVDPDSDTDNGRIDIRYKSAAGAHMIIELKRYGRKTTLNELFAQGARYYSALEDVLARTNGYRGAARIEVVFIVGAEVDPGPTGKLDPEDVIENQLNAINGRILYYDSILTAAERSYIKYVEATKTVRGELNGVLESLDSPNASETDVSDQ